MSHARTVALSLALCLLGAAPLLAQEIDSPYRYIEPRQSLGAFVGHIDTGSTDVDVGLESAPLFGVRYTYRFTGPLSGEASLSGGPTERTIFVMPAGDSVPVALGETGSFLVIADVGLRFHLTGPRTWHGLAPFGTLNAGMVVDMRGGSELEDAGALDQRFDFGPGFAVSIGAGTDWFLTERLSLRLDARDYLWRVTTPSGLTPTGQQQTSWTQNLAFTLGAALHF